MCRRAARVRMDRQTMLNAAEAPRQKLFLAEDWKRTRICMHVQLASAAAAAATAADAADVRCVPSSSQLTDRSAPNKNVAACTDCTSLLTYDDHDDDDAFCVSVVKNSTPTLPVRYCRRCRYFQWVPDAASCHEAVSCTGHDAHEPAARLSLPGAYSSACQRSLRVIPIGWAGAAFRPSANGSELRCI